MTKTVRSLPAHSAPQHHANESNDTSKTVQNYSFFFFCSNGASELGRVSQNPNLDIFGLQNSINTVGIL